MAEQTCQFIKQIRPSSFKTPNIARRTLAQWQNKRANLSNKYARKRMCTIL